MQTENESNTPTPGGQPQVITEQTTCQATDELSAWMDDFISKPAKKAERRVEERRTGFASTNAYTPPPTTFDALVMFEKTVVCSCGAIHARIPFYTGLRKQVKNGYNYLAYTPEMEQSAKGLPRLVIQTNEKVEFCAFCFNGEPITDETPYKQFHPSRQTTLDDLRLFTSKSVDPLPGEITTPTARYNPDGREAIRSE